LPQQLAFKAPWTLEQQPTNLFDNSAPKASFKDQAMLSHILLPCML